MGSANLAPWLVDWLDPAEAIARRARSLLPRVARQSMTRGEASVVVFTGGGPDTVTRRPMEGLGLRVAQ